MYWIDEKTDGFDVGAEGSNATDLTRRSFVAKATIGAAMMGMSAAILGGCTQQASVDSDGADEAETDDADTTSVPEQSAEFVQTPLLTPYAESPLATVEEKAANAKDVLIVVDYQVDFVDGALGRNDLAVALEDAIYDRIKQYRDRGDLVVYTMDTHPLENWEFTREGHLYPSHCVLGTEGWEVYGKVKELLTPDQAYIVRKGTFGARHLPDLLNFIKDQGTVIKTIELAGVSASGCVFHNAILVFNHFPECEIVLDRATTAARSEEDTEAALTQLTGFGCKRLS
jgi:nicotinamidase-related amidase